MTDKQKQAILVLNEALQNKHLDEEEYMILLEFVVQPKQYVPYPIEMSNPLAHPWVTYCKAEIK